jgi:hypothetical protein
MDMDPTQDNANGTQDFDALIDAEIAGLSATETPPEPKETPAADPGEDGKPKDETETAVEAAKGDKPEDKPADAPPEEKKPSLATRLAMVAREDKRIAEDRKRMEAERAALDAQKAEIERHKTGASVVERLRTAPNKVEALREALGGDDEAVAALFLELNEWHVKGDTEKTPEQQRALSEAKLQQLIDATVAAKLADLDAAKKKEEQARTEAAIARYATDALTYLNENKRKFPRCYVAPPEPGTIVAIGEGLHTSLRRVPTADEVLKAIEDYRVARAKEVEDPPETRTAAPNGAEQGGKGKPNTPIRRDDSPVTSPRQPLTFEEALEEELKKEGLA